MASDIDTEWQTLSLREVALKIQDGTHFSPKMGGHEYRYVTSRNLGAGYLKLQNVEMISEAEHRKIYGRCDVKYGDLLLTKDGANTGNAAISTFKEEVSLLSSVAFIRCDPRKATEAYLLQFLLSEVGNRQITDAMSGNAITRLTLGKINALTLPLPPIDEQREIASALSTVDALVYSLQRMIVKKQAIKQGMMQQLLTGKTRLPGFIGDWEYASLGTLGRTFGGLTGKSGADFGDGSGRFVTFMDVMSNMRIDGTRLAAVSVAVGERQSILQFGDILLNGSSETPDELAMASVVANVPAGTMLNSFCFGFRLAESTQADPTYIAYYLRGGAGRRLLAGSAQGATRYNLSKRQFLSLGWEMPGLTEQRAIAAVFEDIDAELQSLRGQLKQIRLVKQGMMQELLTGRTRLTPEKVAA